MPRITIPAPEEAAPNPEGLARVEFLKSRLSDPNRWRQLGGALASRLVAEPLHIMDRAGSAIRGKTVGTPQLAAEAALLTQGLAHAGGAGGTGPAAIGKKLALKKIRKGYRDFTRNPSTPGMHKMMANMNEPDVIAQAKYLPQSAWDNVDDVLVKPLQSGVAQVGGREIPYNTSGYFQKSTRDLALDPVYVDTINPTLTHEVGHASQEIMQGLSGKNIKDAQIMGAIREMLIQKVKEGKITMDQYNDLYRRGKFPNEIHASLMADKTLARQMDYDPKGRTADELTTDMYNEVFEESYQPIGRALERTAPRTLKKAKEYIASGKMRPPGKKRRKTLEEALGLDKLK